MINSVEGRKQRIKKNIVKRNTQLLQIIPNKIIITVSINKFTH